MEEALAVVRPHCEALQTQLKAAISKCASSTTADDDDDDDDDHLTAEEVLERQDLSPEDLRYVLGSSGLTLHYAWLSQRGWYPDTPDKLNQDAFKVIPALGGVAEEFFMGVFDGHGSEGTGVAQFAAEGIEASLAEQRQRYPNDLFEAYETAYKQLNGRIHGQRDLDDSLSGTTAVSALLRGRSLHIANIGDSRAVVGEKQGRRLVATPLSIDQVSEGAECSGLDGHLMAIR